MRSLISTFMVMLLAVSVLEAGSVGRVRFLLGDVQYKEQPNSKWKKAVLNQRVEASASFKTGIDSKVEIMIGQNQSFTVEPKTTITVKKIQQELQSQQKWTAQVREKAATLRLQTNKSSDTAAGIRREEAEVRKSELYWYIPPRQDIQEAIDLFDLKEYDTAIPKFELVIEQGPLKKNAEIARTMLILIYEELQDVPRQKKHYEALKRDFPQSDLLRSMPEIK